MLHDFNFKTAQSIPGLFPVFLGNYSECWVTQISYSVIESVNTVRENYFPFKNVLNSCLLCEEWLMHLA